MKMLKETKEKIEQLIQDLRRPYDFFTESEFNEVTRDSKLSLSTLKRHELIEKVDLIALWEFDDIDELDLWDEPEIIEENGKMYQVVHEYGYRFKRI